MKTIKLIICFILITTDLHSQISLENSNTEEFYVKNNLIGPGIEIQNIKFIGNIGSIGRFEADSVILGISSGIILSTGNTNEINGPNNHAHFTSQGELPKNRRTRSQLLKGDKDLNIMAGSKTQDISVLEFDFIPKNNKLKFNYVFASEEYTGVVLNRCLDVFGFFLSGPYIENKINLATIPQSDTPISISSVNHKTNQEYFRRNGGAFRRLFHKINTWYLMKFLKSPKQSKVDKYNSKLMTQLQFDGLTTVLKVEYDVIPNQKYHIKIAIGDVSNDEHDSAIFLQAQSFMSVIDKEGKYYDSIKVTSNVINEHEINIPFTEKDSLIKIKEEFTVIDIYFESNSAIIKDSFQVELDDIAKYLKDNPTLNCYLYGYTDNLGSKKYNQKLSEERARAVLQYLVLRGVEEKRITISGYNFQNPKSNNKNEIGRANNRRVEILIK